MSNTQNKDAVEAWNKLKADYVPSSSNWALEQCDIIEREIEAAQKMREALEDIEEHGNNWNGVRKRAKQALQQINGSDKKC